MKTFVREVMYRRGSRCARIEKDSGWEARMWGISEDAEVMMKSPNTTEDIERAGASQLTTDGLHLICALSPEALDQ